MVKVLYTLLYLLSKGGLKVPIKPKLSSYGTLLVRLSCRVGSVWSAISVPALGGEPVLRIIAHFWPSFGCFTAHGICQFGANNLQTLDWRLQT